MPPSDEPPPPDLDAVIRLADFEALARERMDPAGFDYVAGGAWDELTLADNEAGFGRQRLLPRVLVDVSSIDTATTMLGTPVPLPVAIAPMAMHGLAHPDAELATARAAAAEGVLFCLSTVSNRSLEEVATAPFGPRWFQLYVHRGRGLTEELVRRAEAAGYGAIVLTVDLPVIGYRERDLRHRFAPDLPFGNFPVPEGGELGEVLSHRHDHALTWDDLAWLRSLSRLPLVVKGVLHADDARLAVEHGAAAVIVSNHGGRQLDRVLATIDALPAVAEAVDGRAEVYLDGGVRRGTDVVTALALGARAVFLGRPVLYALAAAGEAGVRHAFALMRAELETAMALLGTPRPADIDGRRLAR